MTKRDKRPRHVQQDEVQVFDPQVASKLEQKPVDRPFPLGIGAVGQLGHEEDLAARHATGDRLLNRHSDWLVVKIEHRGIDVATTLQQVPEDGASHGLVVEAEALQHIRGHSMASCHRCLEELQTSLLPGAATAPCPQGRQACSA